MNGISLDSVLTLAIAIAGAYTGGLIWGIRLESKLGFTIERSQETQDEVRKVREKYDNLELKIVEKLSEIEKSVAKIEVQLSIKNKDT